VKKKYHFFFIASPPPAPKHPLLSVVVLIPFPLVYCGLAPSFSHVLSFQQMTPDRGFPEDFSFLNCPLI